MQTCSGGKYVQSKWIGQIMKKKKNKYFLLVYGLLSKGDIIIPKYFRRQCILDLRSVMRNQLNFQMFS